MERPYYGIMKPAMIPGNPLDSHDDIHKKTRDVHMSNEKRAPWLFRLFFGDEILPNYMGIFKKPI